MLHIVSTPTEGSLFQTVGNQTNYFVKNKVCVLLSPLTIAAKANESINPILYFAKTGSL